MRSQTRVSKWGNSLAVRIPLAIARQASITEGDSLAVVVDGKGGIVLKPSPRKYDLRELVSGITPKNRHRETEWGGPEGKESW